MAIRHFARLDNTPAQEEEEEGSMLQWKAVGKSLAMFESKRVSGLSIMCNATAHKISVPWRAIEQGGKTRQAKGGERRGRNYKIVRRLTVPKSDLFFSALIRCRQTTVQLTDRLNDRPYDPRTLSKAKPRRRRETETETGGRGGGGGRARRSRCVRRDKKPMQTIN